MIIASFLPILIFISIFVFSGLYYTIIGVENAFYVISPCVAILPAISVSMMLQKGNLKDKIHRFVEGVRQKDIMYMCLIFLLSGAFGQITKKIGCADAIMNPFLSIISPKFILIGVFLVSTILSTAIGSSMATIATVSHIMVSFSNIGTFPISLGVGAIVGGAIFGDNLSLISDTTIASVMSQNADPKKKFILNLLLGSSAAFLTVIVLGYKGTNLLALSNNNLLPNSEFKFLLLSILPYVLLMSLALLGLDVLLVLSISLICTCIIGLINGYSVIELAGSINNGFKNMYEIIILSMFIGGLTELSRQNIDLMAKKLLNLLPKKSSSKSASLLIASIAMLCDFLTANNTIAIILSGGIVKKISSEFNIKPHESATILDIFSCIPQGIIPYGAQILLASSISGISPLSLMGKVYYCYILAIVSIVYILIKKDNSSLR